MHSTSLFSGLLRRTYLFWFPILLIVIISMSGCRDNANRQFLDDAETGIAINPDSVLNLLQNADTTRFASIPDKARFHLLMAEARYKVGIDDTITDHVASAMAYYKDHGSRHDAARAYFYSGLVKSNLGQYTAAAIDLIRAEKIAAADNDTMRLALVYRSIGDTFTKIYNWENALSYYKKSQKNFEAVKAYNYSYNACYDMARSYLAIRNYPLAIKYAQLAYEYAKDINDVSLMKYSLTIIADSYWYLNKYDNAYKLYSEIYELGENLMIAKDYYRLGILHLHFGEINKAREMEKKLVVLDPDDKELYVSLMIHDKKYVEAINGLYNTIDQQNNALHETWSSNLAAEIIKFEQSEEQIILAAHKREKILWIGIIILAIITSALAILLLMRKNKILSMNRDADMEAINRLNETVKTVTYQNGVLSRDKDADTKTISTLHDMVRELTNNRDKADKHYATEIENLKTAVSDSRIIIRDLMANQFTEFSELCQTYFQHEGHKNSQAKIYSKVKTLMSRLSSDNKAMATIETKINTSFNNLMKNFREDFPALNEWEYPLFIYTICGLEPKIIALFLNLKPELIHKRKANLKRKISTSDSPLKDEYLSFFN
ncbi:MAG: hypothetical protein HDR88_03735 [Bacteroides sp.]|nr:hypothetical protein [Bacteroides sp.]